MVIWITGKGTAGKTTTAQGLAKVIPRSVIIDSADFRRYFPEKFDAAGRCNNVLRMARVAAILEQQDFVPIVVCVSPYKALRNEARRLFRESVLIHVPGGLVWKDSTYEVPDRSEIKGTIELDDVANLESLLPQSSPDRGPDS